MGGWTLQKVALECDTSWFLTQVHVGSHSNCSAVGKLRPRTSVGLIKQ